jgi:hypothetical protein
MTHYQYLRDQNLKLPELSDTGFRVFSQNDEDGVLLYIFSLIGTTNKKCLDVAYAGPIGANTTNLICNWGWTGLLIEGNQQGVESLKQFFASHKELDHTNQAQVQNFFTKENPDYVILAAAKVGGIHVNNTYPADFIYQNMMIEANECN